MLSVLVRQAFAFLTSIKKSLHFGHMNLPPRSCSQESSTWLLRKEANDRQCVQSWPSQYVVLSIITNLVVKEAMPCLATAKFDGVPSDSVVLLKSFSKGGFVSYRKDVSQKGHKGPPAPRPDSSATGSQSTDKPGFRQDDQIKGPKC